MPAPKKYRIGNRKIKDILTTMNQNPLFVKRNPLRKGVSGSKKIEKYRTVEIAPGTVEEMLVRARKVSPDTYFTSTHVVWREKGKWYMRRRTI